MNPVYQALSQGVGQGQVARPSQNSIGGMPSRPEADLSPRRHQLISTDDVRLSHRAQTFVVTGPVELPAMGDPGGTGDLTAAIRKVDRFLQDNPRIAQSPFGKSVQSLMRGAAHLVKAALSGGNEPLPAETVEKLSAAVGRVKEFLENHPRIEQSPFGNAVNEMGQAIVAIIGDKSDRLGSTAADQTIQAAGQTALFLEENPKIAAMPLGQAVETLIGGVGDMADGKGIAPDIQNLAKRIFHFVGNHQRLAESEFGQLIAGLTRGILALDASVPPDVAPPVAGGIRRDAAVPADSGDRAIVEVLEAADMQKAA